MFRSASGADSTADSTAVDWLWHDLTLDGAVDVAGEVDVHTPALVQLCRHHEGREETRRGVVQQLPAAVVVDAAPGWAGPGSFDNSYSGSCTRARRVAQYGSDQFNCCCERQGFLQIVAILSSGRFDCPRLSPQAHKSSAPDVVVLPVEDAHGAGVGRLLEAAPVAHRRVIRQRLLRLREVYPAPEAPADARAANVSVAPQRERRWRADGVLAAACDADRCISMHGKHTWRQGLAHSALLC